MALVLGKKGRAVLREHERIVREALAAHGGSEVKDIRMVVLDRPGTGLAPS